MLEFKFTALVYLDYIECSLNFCITIFDFNTVVRACVYRANVATSPLFAAMTSHLSTVYIYRNAFTNQEPQSHFFTASLVDTGETRRRFGLYVICLALIQDKI